MVLKKWVAGPLVQAVLYSNINVREEDDPLKRRQKLSLRQAAARFERCPERRVAAMIFLNFDTSAWWCTFTFTDDRLPETRRQVRSRWNTFTTALKRAGFLDLKFIQAIQLSGEGGDRWHIHAILSGAPKAEIQKAWSYYGGCHIKHLKMEDVVFPAKTAAGKTVWGGIANYLTREDWKRKTGEHSYSTSRGRNRLASPTVERRVVSDSFELTVPPGCIVIDRDTMAENPFGRAQRLSYMMENWEGASGVGARNGCGKL